MSYTKRRSTPAALSGVTDVALAAASVVQDPCLYDVAGLLLRLNQLEGKPGTTSTTTSTTTKGIGLCKAVPVLKAVVYVRERPWLGVAAAAGVVGVLFAAGYLTGRSGKR